MKKLIYILLFVYSFAKAQHPIIPFLNPAVEDYAAQCSTKPDLKVTVAINKGINYWVATGDWPYFATFFLYANDTEANGKINIAHPTSSACTGVNSPTWTQYAGMLSNHTSSYYNTNHTPQGDSAWFKKNSNFTMLYIHDNPTPNSSAECGVFNNGNFDGTTNIQAAIYAKTTGGPTGFYYANSLYTGSYTGDTPPTTTIGTYLDHRINATSVELYNPFSLTTPQQARSSTASTLLNFNIYVGAQNIGGTGINRYSNHTISVFATGNGAANMPNLIKGVGEIQALIGF